MDEELILNRVKYYLGLMELKLYLLKHLKSFIKML